MQLMRKRSLSIVLLTSAFLFSAWSNVIGAAFCPRYMNRVCCARPSAHRLTPVIDQSSCHHHEMAGMKMDQSEKALDMQEQSGASSDFEVGADATKATSQPEPTSSNEVAFDLPVETCGHCWMHSQLTSGTAMVLAVDPSKRIIETDAPLTKCALALPSTLPASIKPSEHGPPGNSFPRHVLINVFRI